MSKASVLVFSYSKFREEAKRLGLTLAARTNSWLPDNGNRLLRNGDVWRAGGRYIISADPADPLGIIWKSVNADGDAVKIHGSITDIADIVPKSVWEGGK